MNKYRSLFIAACVLTICGCATVRHPVPPELVTEADMYGMDEIRVMDGEPDSEMQQNLLLSVKQERDGDYPPDANGVKHYPILAVSGGGANGAYGAGLMKGWSEEGSRPVFKIVTGVSTGAIMAPFIFLGRDYDDELERFYTSLSTKEVMTSNGILAPLFNNSLASNKPLDDTLEKLIDEKFLGKIESEHRRGRRLFIGTANLDAQRFVIWDMGAIAMRGDTELFRKVMLASAAIPVIFPPAIFEVKAAGKTYDEIHADGGTMTQVFTAYKLLEGLKGAAEALNIDLSKLKAKLYIIRNGYVTPIYKSVPDTLPDLAARSFDTIIDTQGIGDTYRIYVFTIAGGNDYNLAFIPADYKQNAREMFDPQEMKRLFDRGYQDAVKGYKWYKTPPGLSESAAYSVEAAKALQ